MALDKWIAVFFLTIALAYGYASFTYSLLPFERNMTFLPNTMPKVLSGLGILFSLIIILSPKKATQADEASLGDFDVSNIGQYKIGQALGLIAAMILYALALRPVGFILATILFLVGTGWVLGERKVHIMFTAASIGTVGIWYLVQEALGIFLRPLPWFLS